jgi:hypothetical protein
MALRPQTPYGAAPSIRGIRAGEEKDLTPEQNCACYGRRGVGPFTLGSVAGRITTGLSELDTREPCQSWLCEH